MLHENQDARLVFMQMANPLPHICIVHPIHPTSRRLERRPRAPNELPGTDDLTAFHVFGTHIDWTGVGEADDLESRDPFYATADEPVALTIVVDR